MQNPETFSASCQHDMIELLQEGMAPLGVITPIPWLLVLIQDIPGIGSGPKKFTKYHLEQIAARKKVSTLFHSNLYDRTIF
jgi:hypothetical protein